MNLGVYYICFKFGLVQVFNVPDMNLTLDIWECLFELDHDSCFVLDSRSLSTGRKVKVRESSERLLLPTSSMINSMWRGSSVPPTSRRVKISDVKVSERLLTPTAALENGKYRKLDADVDPRILGWKKIMSKKSEIPPLNDGTQFGSFFKLYMTIPSIHGIEWYGSTVTPKYG